MATFVCLHGAGGRGRDWRLVADHLAHHGHEVLGVDLPVDQPVGLEAYVAATVAAIGDRTDDLAIVGQSLAGLVAPIVAARVPARLLVLVGAMVPSPGETGGDWWTTTGQHAAMAAQGLPDQTDETLYLHDVPADVLATMEPPRDQTGEIFEDPWPLDRWPDVPTRFLAFRDDRLFPASWLVPLARERIGIEPDVVPGGHCAYLSEPAALAAALARCWEELG